MKKVMKINNIFYSLLLVLLSGISFSDDQLKSLQLMQHVQNATVPIEFYGQVLDQNSQPIQDVNVTVEVIYYDPTQEENFYENEKIIQFATDADGKFQLSDEGRQITVKMQKTGCEYIYSVNPPDTYDYELVHDLHQPDVNSPVIFYLYKKTYPVYLTGGKTSARGVLQTFFNVPDAFQTSFYITEGYNDAYGKAGLMPDGTTLGYDKYRRGTKDIQVSGNVSGSNYEITFTPLVQNSGLIVSDNFLEEAPDTGYTSSATISVPTDSRATINKYIYAKVSEASFYSRFDVRLVTGTRGEWLLIVTSWTNPLGSRNLNFDEEYQDYEEAWRERLSDLRYAATELDGKLREDYLVKYELGDILGIKPDGTFNEALFRQEADALKAQLKTEDSHWWHALE